MGAKKMKLEHGKQRGPLAVADMKIRLFLMTKAGFTMAEQIDTLWDRYQEAILGDGFVHCQEAYDAVAEELING